MEAFYTLEEIIDLIKGIKDKPEPFYGETTIKWDNGRMILWKESGTRKPKREALPKGNKGCFNVDERTS